MSATSTQPQSNEHLVVIGGGPGGYSAAFRAADLGFEVTLVERYPVLGGVCLNVGCIPSKTLLHASAVIRAAQGLKEQGIVFDAPEIKPKALMQFKDSVIARLNKGLATLAKKRHIRIIHDTACFHSEHELKLTESSKTIGFDKAIIATGSRNRRIENKTDDTQLMYSGDALNIKHVPSRLLIVGGGIIGIENAFIYQGLGSAVEIAELQPQLLDMCDSDISKPLLDQLNNICDVIYTQAQVGKIENDKNRLLAEIKTPDTTITRHYDAVLISTGRLPNSDILKLDAINLLTDDNGFIMVDECMRTNVTDIYAVGDVIGNPMLAHKASHQGKVAAEHAAGMRVSFSDEAIPSVIYSDPELAWVGITEKMARKAGIDCQSAVFPWQASGRALGTKRGDGLSKLIYHSESKKLLGGAVCGAGADELIAEIALALEMDSDLYDVALSVHPHPTYAETISQTAELALGTVTELYTGIPNK